MLNKKLWIGFGVLVAINLLLGALLVFQKPQTDTKSDNKAVRNIVIERLRLNDIQIKAYEKLIAEHHKEMRPIEKRLRKAKDGLYLTLESSNGANPDPYLKEISEIHDQIEINLYTHFLKIRELCEGDQKAKFDEMARDLGPILGPKPGGPPHRKMRPRHR